MRASFTATILSLAAAALLGFGLVQLTTPHSAEPIGQSGAAVPMEDAENYEYLLKNYQGRLAVSQRGSTAPDLVFDVYVKTLPELDQSQLQNGVAAKDYAELVSLIEDYTS